MTQAYLNRKSAGRAADRHEPARRCHHEQYRREPANLPEQSTICCKTPRTPSTVELVPAPIDGFTPRSSSCASRRHCCQSSSGSSYLCAGPSSAQDKPYKEGTVWSVSFIKVKPGMLDVYMRDLATQRKKLMDEAKKQGLIVSERMFSGAASGREDWDLMLMVEFENWVAFDGLSDKFDALALKLVGSEEMQTLMTVKRGDVREIMGTKTVQELTFK
jgi:hypothetical protein